MLVIDETAQERFNEILDIASLAPPEVGRTLLRSLATLAYYRNKDNTVTIFPDFAPLSLAFTVRDPDGKHVLNGGLIYQGPEQPADGGAPSFTVSLNNNTGWFIHT